MYEHGKKLMPSVGITNYKTTFEFKTRSTSYKQFHNIFLRGKNILHCNISFLLESIELI